MLHLCACVFAEIAGQLKKRMEGWDFFCNLALKGWVRGCDFTIETRGWADCLIGCWWFHFDMFLVPNKNLGHWTRQVVEPRLLQWFQETSVSLVFVP